MKQKLSKLQLILLAANFIFTSSIISLPQIIVQMAGHSAWIVPVITFPLIFFLVSFVFGKKRMENGLDRLFLIHGEQMFSEKIFIGFFLLLAVLAFLRDVRGLIDFVASVLLPTTPIDVLLVLTILVIPYIAMSGLEVIARMNVMHFVFLAAVVLLLPLMLINKLQLGNFFPLWPIHTAPAIFKALYFAISWVGEIVFFFLILSNVQPIKEAKKLVLSGATLGLLLFFIIITLEIGVLGEKIVQESAYPSYLLSQQISITDFFERIDLIIASVWIPAIIIKTAYLLYAINHCFSYFYKSNTNKFLFPFSLILGLLSILFFKNTMEVLNFSFYVWSSLGLMLELVIVMFFFVIKKKKIREMNAANKPIK